MFRKVNNDGDKQHLQNDLHKLVKWSIKWQTLLHFGKCKCLHTGHKNLYVNYKMGDTVPGTTIKEKDLGVRTSADRTITEWNTLSTDCATVICFKTRLTCISLIRVGYT